MDGKTQEAAAASSGMSIVTARKWLRGPLPSSTRKARHWRTRPDSFVDVWEGDVVPLLKRDKGRVLQASTILEELERQYPGRFSARQVRTLQRRMRDWRALYGPDKEVFFEQVHPPGREMACDFTWANDLGVTIAGEPLKHLIFEVVLSHSKRTWADVAFGETYEALLDGLQRALWSFGAVPQVIRLDNLSAATHELRRGGGRALNERFRAVLDHYGTKASLITPGRAHENGIAEQRHYRTISALAQALVLRGSRDFERLEAYRSFITETLERSHNRHTTERFEEERRHLRPLPSSPVPSYTEYAPVVRRWSTIRVGGRTYSLPSRLRGHQVQVHQYPDTLEVYYAGKRVETMPRLRGKQTHRIDYRHIIGSLVRKPGAFARYRYREELFPRSSFREAYDRLCTTHGDRADVEYVRILHLAAQTMESRVDEVLRGLLSRREPFDYAQVRRLVDPEPPPVPEIRLAPPDLGVYDRLLVGGAV